MLLSMLRRNDEPTSAWLNRIGYDSVTTVHLGLNALHCAVVTGDLTACKWLRENGGEKLVRAETAGGDTPLSLGCREGQMEAVQYLLETEAVGDLRKRNCKNGLTPMHRACASGNLRLVQWLSSVGAQGDIRDVDPKNGYTPMLEAATNGKLHVCKVRLHTYSLHTIII